MTTGTQRAESLVGQISAGFGALALVGVAWVAVLTFSSLDPPEAVRITGTLFLPLGLGGAVGAGIAGRHGASRPWALLGMALAAAAVVALTLMQLAAGY